jgi:hypothetical protein
VPEAEQPPAVPGPVRAIALLVAVEAAALLLLAGAQALSTVLGEPTSVGGALVTAAFAALGGVLVLLLARAVLRVRKAARSPVVVVQLIMLPIGWNLIHPSGRPEFGVPVLAVAVAVLALLATPAARAALEREDRV